MKTIIIYESKYGCVKTCAEYLKKKIDGDVSICNIARESVADLDHCDRVIIGASVYVGSVPKSMKGFCNKNTSKLIKKKINVFLCCLLDGELKTVIDNNFPKELVESALQIRSFGGRVAHDKLKFSDKLIIKAVSKMVKEIDLNADVNYDAMEDFIRKMR